MINKNSLLDDALVLLLRNQLHSELMQQRAEDMALSTESARLRAFDTAPSETALSLLSTMYRAKLVVLEVSQI